MAIDYPAILALAFPEERWSWTSDQSILYALAVGVPPFSDDPAEQRYIHRRLGPEVLPSFLSVAGASGQLSARRIGIDRRRRLHGAQSLIVHAPPPPEGVAITQVTIEECLDKGDSGAAIVSRGETFDSGGRHLATTRMTSFARGDGHFGGPRGGGASAWVAPRAADIRLTVPITPLSPALFGLIRDKNPLHTDPEAASRSGFTRPVVHGLCLFGIACRLAMTRIQEFRGLRFAEQHVRFAGPVHPGDVLDFSFWIEGHDLRFVADVQRDGRPALSHGLTRFATDNI
jgi:acyl dehydratase